jgi:hypothetical protein
MRKVFARLARNGTALAFVALAAIGVGVAVGAIPSNGQINGCFVSGMANRRKV